MNDPFPIKLTPILRGTALKRGAIFGAILVAALLAFELFNYSTTAFALWDMLGDLSSMNLRWSTILAIAFCGIDFAGIARLFTPQLGREETAEAGYLFGAWLLAAGFNATLTWWGVSVAIRNHTAQGSILVGQELLVKVVPVFVAVMVWMIRVLVIGTFSIAGENLFSVAHDRPASRPAARPLASTMHLPPAPSYPRPAPKPVSVARPLPHSEPTYHPVGMSARSYEENSSIRR